jgi:3-dehydroquinate dehydratase type I
VRVCVAVPPKTVKQALQYIEEAETQHADLVEIRLDSLTSFDDITGIASSTKTPLIATNKPSAFGGKYTGTEPDRQQVLLTAARNGFEYVDVDLGTHNQTELISKVHDLGAKVIVSFHDFVQKPSLSVLEGVFVDQVALGADICKLVTTAQNVDDNLTVLKFVSGASKKCKVVCFAMGEQGKSSRLLSPVFGAFFTFACLSENMKTANGQLTIQELHQAYTALGYR